MMTRASRMLKWIGAGTVLFAAAPIAYADSARHTGSPSSAAAPSTSPRSPSPRPGGAPDTGALRCGQDPSDFAGTYTVAGRDDMAVDFQADGTVSALRSGDPAATGSWHADGTEVVWTAGAVTYTSVTRSSTCADPAHATLVTSFAATPTSGSAGSLGSDPFTLQRR